MIRSILLSLALLAPHAFPRALSAQGAGDRSSVAALEVALYTAGANVQESGDTAIAALATEVLRRKLAELLGPALVDPGTVDQAASTDAARTAGGGKPCNVIVACARHAAGAVGAEWAVMAKVSKTSNLIWLFTGQLIEVATGRLLMDDSIELKGDPEPMVRAGTRNFAERVARTVRRQAVSGR